MDEVQNLTKEVDLKDLAENKEKPKEELTAEQKVQDALKDYKFIQFSGNVFIVNHDELKDTLKPKILTMGDMSARGRILNGLNGGAALGSVDPDTLALNSFMALAQIGFENLKFDVSKIKDVNLLDALYLAVKTYNTFFRSVPLGMLV
jgi:ABC-type Fe3+ transport system substrate-binding protein